MTLGARVRLNLRQFRNAEEQILRKIGAEMRRHLIRRAAMIRKIAMNSMSRTGPVSLPGHPPRRVTGLLADWIIFKWDPSAESVVVGPAYMGGRVHLETVEVDRWIGPRGGVHIMTGRVSAARPVRPTVPEVLETGGSISSFVRTGMVWERQPSGGYSKRGVFKKKMIKIAARPYMAPAMERSRKVYPELWKTSLV